MDNRAILLSPDRPFDDPRNDRLGYAKFAEQLAQSICVMSPPDGLVLAIYGSWGSGKSTLLGFIEHYINEHELATRPVVIKFNPWWFSGYEDLTRSFFAILSEQIASAGRRLGKTIKDRAAKLSEVIGTGAELLSLPGAEGVDKITEFLRRPAEMTEAKKRLSDALKKGNKRILVIIDDIDRLTSDEIRQLFGTVKAVADFPNVIYLLSFDKNVVVRALSESQGIPGTEYLEKIVQVPLELPTPDRFSLFNMFREKVEEIVSGTEAGILEKAEWKMAFSEVCERFIQTPRDVSRIGNALILTYPLVVNEVNPSDFVAIETLRLTYPELYAIIRNNPFMFAGTASFIAPAAAGADDPLSGYREFVDNAIAKIGESERPLVKRALTYLFPKVRAYYGSTRESPEVELERRADLRISSEARFPVYFRLSIPTGGISNSELRATIALAHEPETFARRLLQMRAERRTDGASRLVEFLHLIGDLAQAVVPNVLIEPVLQGLVNIDDSIIDESQPATGMDQLTFSSVRSILACLAPLDEPSRFEILERTLRTTTSITTPIYLVRTLGEEHGKFNSGYALDDDARTVNAEHLDQLVILMVHKLRESGDALLNTKNLPRLVRYWEALSDAEGIRKWLSQVLEDDAATVRLLYHFITSSDQFSPVVKTLVTVSYGLDLRMLLEYVDENTLNARIREISVRPDLPPKLHTALSNYVEYLDIPSAKDDQDKRTG